MKAFPNNRSEGMELRDYFAAKAMQALIPISMKTIADELVTPKNVVDSAYQWADAMMEARKVAAPENKREFTADEMLKGRG